MLFNITVLKRRNRNRRVLFYPPQHGQFEARDCTPHFLQTENARISSGVFLYFKSFHKFGLILAFVSRLIGISKNLRWQILLYTFDVIQAVLDL